MKKIKFVISIVLCLSGFSSFSQLKVLSSGTVNIGGGHTGNTAALNLHSDDDCTIYSKSTHGAPWGESIKSQVTDDESIGLSVWHNSNRTFMVLGDGDVWSATNIYGSDSILKVNVKTLDPYLLKDLRGVSFERKNDKKVMEDGKKRTHYGFVAQEVEAVYPELVHKNEDGVRGVAYVEFIPILLEKINMQQEEIEQLHDAIADIQENCCGSSRKSASIQDEGDSNPSVGIQTKSAELYQNIPNPFSQTTTISCYIPITSSSSSIYIFNLQGTLVKQFPLDSVGDQEIVVNGNSLDAGMYIYSLVIDNKEVDSKRMILTE